MQIFLAAPFADPGVLRALVGDADCRDLRKARVDGYRLCSEGPAVAMAPAPTGVVEGVLVDCGAATAARIRYAMAVLGAAPLETEVTTDAGPVAAEVFAAPEAAGSEDWYDDAGRRSVLREVIDEVMAHHGARSASDLAPALHGIGFRALARHRGRAREVPRSLGSGLGEADVARVERRLPYARYFGVEEHRLGHRRFDGGWSPEVERAVLVSGDAVTVVPFDPRRGNVLLVEQFRVGPAARRDPHPWCLEAVAGRCDGLEPPEDAARREAVEEAGLTLGRMERIAAYYSSPGIASEFITAFVGEADLGEAGGLHGLDEEDEDIRALVVPLEAALAAVASGEIGNAPLILSLFWLESNRRRLTEAWV